MGRTQKKNLTKEILKWLLIIGMVCIAGNSPYFARNILRAYKKWRIYKSKKIYNTFYYLKRQGLIEIVKSNHQYQISLTDEGRKKAGKLQIDNIEIKKPSKWDGRWRVIIFDVPQDIRIKREIFRSKLKELKFYPLQKSVWIYPYDCQKEISLLRNFFNLSKNNIRLIEAQNIEEDKFLKNYFKLT